MVGTLVARCRVPGPDSRPGSAHDGRKCPDRTAHFHVGDRNDVSAWYAGGLKGLDSTSRRPACRRAYHSFLGLGLHISAQPDRTQGSQQPTRPDLIGTRTNDNTHPTALSASPGVSSGVGLDQGTDSPAYPARDVRITFSLARLFASWIG